MPFLKLSAIILMMCVIMIASSCANKPPITSLGVTVDTTPRKVMVYEIQNGKDFVGSAHKYEWEPQLGRLVYYYLIYDVQGRLVGNIRQDGMTQIYEGDEIKILGHRPVQIAMAEVLAVPLSVRIEPTLDEIKAEQEFALAEYKDPKWEKIVSSSASRASEQATKSAQQPEETTSKPEPPAIEEENWPDAEESWEVNKK